nr:unnamed protein product [Spirometra erinaceieuropaei]
MDAIINRDEEEDRAKNGALRTWLSRQSSFFYKANTMKRRIVLDAPNSSAPETLRTYFTFYGTIYEQVKGTPMGSPISGFIAEAVLQRLESLVFQHHKPKFWARYVDDTFVVIDRDQLLKFKDRPNVVVPDIQITMEEEENNQLAFLDVLVCRKDCGGLKTKVFRKATNTMQVLNFNSNHPIIHKRSCVRTLYRRVETHCSEPEDKIAEVQYLRRVFKANGYPRNFVDRCDLAVETIELILREKNDETENSLGHAQIIQLLKFCLKTYLTFDGTIYE